MMRNGSGGVWRVAACLWLAAVSGCGESIALDEPVPVRPLKSVADPLSAQEVELFLKIVAAHPQQKSPEFSYPQAEGMIDPGLPPEKFAEEYRQRFHRRCDAQRQGEVWQRDLAWRTALRHRDVLQQARQLPRATPADAPPGRTTDDLERCPYSTAEFAALVQRVAYAVIRQRLQGECDLQRAALQSRAVLDDLSAQITRLDQVPRQQHTAASVYARTQASIRLSKVVALRELADILLKVPAESVRVVEQYQQSLRPLLPAGELANPFMELDEIQASPSPRAGVIQPVEHRVPRKR